MGTFELLELLLIHTYMELTKFAEMQQNHDKKCQGRTQFKNNHHACTDFMKDLAAAFGDDVVSKSVSPWFTIQLATAAGAAVAPLAIPPRG